MRTTPSFHSASMDTARRCARRLLAAGLLTGLSFALPVQAGTGGGENHDAHMTHRHAAAGQRAATHQLVAAGQGEATHQHAAAGQGETAHQHTAAGHHGNGASHPHAAAAAQGVVVDGAYTVAPRPGVPNIAIYISRLDNTGNQPDQLVSARTDIARSTELHEMKMEGELMRMRQVGGIDIPAGGSVNLNKGGGYHLMVMGVNRPLKAGDQFPLTLMFRHAGERVIQVSVQQTAAPAAGMDHSAHGHSHHQH